MVIIFDGWYLSRRGKDIQDQRYLKCGQNVIIMSATGIGTVTLKLVYSCSSRLFLFSIYYLILTDIACQFPSMLGVMLFCPRNPCGGKNTRSVLDAFVPRPMCISSPNLLEWEYIKFSPTSIYSLFSKANVSSPTYRMKNRDNKQPCENLVRF